MRAQIASINVNSVAIQNWIPRLDAIHRSAFPLAIRKTINQAAMDVKSTTMPAESSKVFKKRKPTFWSATSHVDFAKGFDVKSMAASVGFEAPNNVKESGHATKDLEHQEKGGAIDKRAFIATTAGRTAAGNVREGFTMAKIKRHIVDAKNEQGKNQAEKFIKAAIKAGRGNFVITPWQNQRGNKFLVQINNIRRRKRGDIISYKEIYSVKKHRKAKVKATGFMQHAAIDTAAKMEAMFIKNANIEITKIRKP